VSRKRVFATLLGFGFLVNFARVVFAPLVEPLMATFGVGAGAAGLVATLAWLGSAAPRIPVGYLLTRVSRKRVVFGAGLLLVLAAATAAVAPTIVFLGASAFLMGTATGAYFIAANPLVSELFPEGVGRAIGSHYTAAQVAAVVAGPLVTLALALGDFRLVFAGMVVVTLAVTASFRRTSTRTDLPEAGVEDRDLLAAARAQWKLLLTGVAILGVGGFVWNGVFNFYVTFLKTTGMAETTARNLLTVVFAAGIPAIWGSGRLADRVSYVPLLLGTIGSFAAVLLALSAVRGFFPLIAVSVVLGLVVHALFPVVDAYLLDSLPDRHRASAYSVYSGVTLFVMATGSSAVGALTEAGVSFPVLFRGFAVLLGAVVLVLGALDLTGRLP
jgi:predicted MFS family arabinose efflux permease